MRSRNGPRWSSSPASKRSELRRRPSRPDGVHASFVLLLDSFVAQDEDRKSHQYGGGDADQGPHGRLPTWTILRSLGGTNCQFATSIIRIFRQSYAISNSERPSLTSINAKTASPRCFHTARRS